jgi:integrase
MTNRRKREYLTQEEISKLLAASKTASRNPEHDYCILLLMFRHGLRVSELCSLKLSDIDLESKTFHVRRLKGCEHGSHFFYDGESAAIKSWLAKRQKMNAPATLEELFISERRRPLSRVTILSWFARSPCAPAYHIWSCIRTCFGTAAVTCWSIKASMCGLSRIFWGIARLARQCATRN